MNTHNYSIQQINIREQASAIYHLFQNSYKVEAAFAKAEKFPPLLWTVEMIQERPGSFFGILDNDELIAGIEVRETSSEALISSLVVEPKYFKKGFGSRLMQIVLDHYPQNIFFVETAAANHPAISLYQKFGFVLIKEYIADLGIPKVRLELKRGNV